MFPALTTRTAFELFYSHLGQRALSVANYWYDPRHRDLYLKYSVYLAVIDNVKPQESTNVGTETTDSNSDNDCGAILTKTNLSSSSNESTIIVRSNDDTTKIMEARVAAVITAVSTATVKVAEGHNVNNGNEESFTTTATIDAIMANNTDHCYPEENYCRANINTRKMGLTRLQKMVLIGGPDDGVISPWQSRYTLNNIRVPLLQMN